MKLVKLLLFSAFLALFVSAPAYAQSFLSPEVLVNTNTTSDPNLLNEWQDDSVEWLLNKVDDGQGNITWTDSNSGDSELDVGDRIRGTIEMTGVGDTDSGLETIGGTTDYHELTGIFDITVLSATQGSTGSWLYTFGATNTTDSGFTYADSVVEFYIDYTGTNDYNGSDTRAGLIDSVDDGTHVLSLGFDNVDDYWFSVSASNDVSVLGGLQQGQSGGTGYFALSVLWESLSFDFAETEDITYIDTTGWNGTGYSDTADADVFGNTILLNAGGSSGDIRDDTDMFFNANAVPEPTTFTLLGLGLIGFAGVARRRW